MYPYRRIYFLFIKPIYTMKKAVLIMGRRSLFRTCTLCLLLALCGSVSVLAQTPVQRYGGLSVDGNQIVDEGGDAFSVAGNSFFWSNTGWGAEPFYNAQAVSWLKEDWQSNIVRAAMGVEDNGGYLTDPTGNRNRVITVVDAAIDEGLYAIIDWHSHHAEDYQSQAVSFFQDMARRYGDSDNVIYEIYNEPINSSWGSDIKPYAEAVIAAIRAIDPDNLIIVGTPFYSQNVDVASQNPITGYANIAYSFHFYAGTHGQSLRNKITTARNNGIAIMVTEWGTVNANGDGGVATASTNEWMSFLRENELTHLNWSVHDKAEGASALRPGASPTGGWSTNDLTASGTLVRDIMRDWNEDPSGGGEPESSLSLSSSSLSFDAASASDRVNVSGNVSWSVTDNRSWISVTPTSGSGNGSFTVQVAAHSGTSARNGTVTVSGGGLTRSLTVAQQGVEDTGGGGDTDATCESPTAVSLPFSRDGAGTYCLVTSGNVNFINSWNTELVEINGVDFTNKWSNSMPARIDGKYYIRYRASVGWAHLEVVGSGTARTAQDGTKTDIKMYPNPASETVTLRDLDAYQRITITNFLGQVFLDEAVTEKTMDVSLQQFKRGVYLVKAHGSDVGQKTSLLIVE